MPREVPRRRPATREARAALVAAGHDTIQTSELPGGNRTTDACIADVADRDDRVVVTKDSDFRGGHLITGSPERLLMIATGNITNAALLALVETHLETVVAAFDDADFVELATDALITHDRRAGPPAEVSAHVTSSPVWALHR